MRFGAVWLMGAALVGAGGAAQGVDSACGWAMPAGQTLSFNVDPRVDPRRGGALPRPPVGAVAMFCRRDGMAVDPRDFRVLRELRLPFIIESGGRFAVLQASGVELRYHTEGDRFVRGRAPTPEEQKTRT